MLIAPPDFPLLPQRDTHKHHNHAPPSPHPLNDDSIVRRALKNQLTFMATVAFPSPSTILRSPVLQPAPSPEVATKTKPKKQSATRKTQKLLEKKLPDSIKPKQTKSRDGKFTRCTTVLSCPVTTRLTVGAGCKNCKEKRLKCDEAKPKCMQCHKKSVECRGYEKVLKWRPQEDAFTNNTYSPRPRKSMLRTNARVIIIADTTRIYSCYSSITTSSKPLTVRSFHIARHQRFRVPSCPL